MTVLHTGWTKKFGSGWDSIFGGKKSATKPKATKTTPKKAAVKGVKKKATAKKTSKRKR